MMSGYPKPAARYAATFKNYAWLYSARSITEQTAAIRKS